MEGVDLRNDALGLGRMGNETAGPAANQSSEQ